MFGQTSVVNVFSLQETFAVPKSGLFCLVALKRNSFFKFVISVMFLVLLK